MGKTKINFEIEEEILANAKAYVSRHGGSLNKLVNALFAQLGQRLEVPAIDPHKKILLELSCGKISLMEATRLLGFQDAGYTLHLMAEEGLPMKRLSEETVRRQAAVSLDAMRECLISSNNKAKRVTKPHSPRHP